MDLKKLAEPFPADDIEWRIQSSGLSGGNPWARVLAYVTARAIMARLDKVVGPENWRPRYTYEGGGVMCHLSINIRPDADYQRWVEKSDGAEQTDIEKFKGGISSALKRAASIWGIGRYLYKLESGFAECDKNTKKYPNYGKTKDGVAFSWKPPDLPPWALPDVESSTNGGAAPESKTKEHELSLEGDTALGFPGSEIPSAAEAQGKYMELCGVLYKRGLDVEDRGFARGDSKRLGAGVLEERIIEMQRWLRDL